MTEQINHAEEARGIEMLPIAKFLYARIAEDENALLADERHWSEVPSEVFSHERIEHEILAKKKIVLALSLVADLAWTQSYAVRDHGRRMLETLADVYADHPDYETDWWSGL